MVPPANFEPVGHYSEKVIKIGEVIWRKRAHVQGRVTAIRTSPANQAPMFEVEMWDETGGITLQFLGRRSLAGLDVGAQLRAEGMVGEVDGLLTILNPNYELLH
jgi:RecG-like helicase